VDGLSCDTVVVDHGSWILQIFCVRSWRGIKMPELFVILVIILFVVVCACKDVFFVDVFWPAQ
jgi:hypothetical membrane protein